jgi:hypothetical protein
MVNLALLTVFLLVAAPEVTWYAFGEELLRNAEDFSSFLWNGFQQLP